MSKKRILVAVLDWGLGHATRSIPVIRGLQTEGFEPVIATSGAALHLLGMEFPHLNHYKLPGYPISYSEKGKFLKWKLFLKSPLFLKTIFSEKREIDRILRTESVQGIISDSCPGAFSSSLPCVYISHQLQVLSGNTTFFTTKAQQYFINKFNECWVPDDETKTLSGRMSDPSGIAIPVKHLGINSRFRKRELPQQYDLTVLLSGPEPQRSLLEEKLLKELVNFEGRILFIRGKVEKQKTSEKRGNLEILNFLSGSDLETVLNQSKMVLARSGYSTLLDLAVLEKKAFFIPTPGQYEQKYLARRMKLLGIADSCEQEVFDCQQLKNSSDYPGFKDFSAVSDYNRIFSFFKGK